MRTVDVRVHGRKAIGETLGDEALGREVVTLIKLILADDVKDARITFQARGVQLQPIGKLPDSRESARRIFERDSPDEAVNFIAQADQMFRQIAAVLARNTRNESFLHHHLFKLMLATKMAAKEATMRAADNTPRVLEAALTLAAQSCVG